MIARSQRSLAFLVVLAGMLVLAASGCGERQQPATSVRGQVRSRGYVVRDGAIVFAPDTSRGTPDILAMGQIQPDGTYRLASERGAPLAPGWYRVSIVAARSRLAEKYSDPQRSGLQCEVRRGEENVIDFNLE